MSLSHPDRHPAPSDDGVDTDVSRAEVAQVEVAHVDAAVAELNGLVATGHGAAGRHA